MTTLLLAVIYITFISLGLPDTLLGACWPTMYLEFGVPLSYAGIISMTIALGTIISALLSDRMTKAIGVGKITAFSVATTCVALFGFAISHSFLSLFIWAIPYGLGAGGVDAAINNYVALHYESHHMSWLHCMWGLGAATGPYIITYALTHSMGWNGGYLIISILQVALTTVIFISLPLWKKPSEGLNSQLSQSASEDMNQTKAISIKEIVAIPGAIQLLIAFFCYCALEQTAMLWASSYLNLHGGLTPQKAASLAGMFCVGITLGRAANGFIAMKLDDTTLIRGGCVIIGIGAVLMIIPTIPTAIIGFILVGIGCAPVYPCIIHSTPTNFGADKSQALIGVQMACAYIGILIMPPLFGVIANNISISLLPFYLLGILSLLFVMHETMLKKINA